MQTSARFGVQYPSADRTDAPDIPTHLANIVAGLEQAAMYGQGPIASRPASTVGTPGKQGRIYASTDETPQHLYYDFGTGWFDVGALAAGAVGTTQLADAGVTLAKLAANSVDSSKIVDGSIVSADIADGTIAAGDIASALKPSAGAGAGTEALRALGTAAGQAAAGLHAAQHLPGGADALSFVPQSVYRTVATFIGRIQPGNGNLDYALGLTEQIQQNLNGAPLSAGIWVDPADYAVTGKNTRFRIVLWIASNAVAPAASFFARLETMSHPQGGSGVITNLRTGESQSSSTSPTLVANSAGTIQVASSSDFAFPTGVGQIVAGALNASGPIAANSGVQAGLILQVRNV